MKAMDIIDRLDGLEPNQYSPEQKLRWLSILDGKIYEEVLRPRETEPKGFTESVNGNEELLVPFPSTISRQWSRWRTRRRSDTTSVCSFSTTPTPSTRTGTTGTTVCPT